MKDPPAPHHSQARGGPLQGADWGTTPGSLVHGTADRMCAPSGGRATAAVVPWARLVPVPGLGHDLPRGAWPLLLDAVVATARRAG